jgi:hypothetical protein
LPKKVAAHIQSSEYLDGLVYEVMCRSTERSCCRAYGTLEIEHSVLHTQAGSVDEMYAYVGTFKHPVFSLRRDKLRPNTVDTIGEIGTNCGVRVLNACDLDYMRAASRMVKRVALIVGRMYGCTSILDIGTGKGGDAHKLPMFSKVQIVEPGEKDYREAMRRLTGKVGELRGYNAPLREVDNVRRHTDIVVAFFCMNLFEDADIERLVQLMGAAETQCVILLYVDEMPRAYKGKHTEVVHTGHHSYRVVRRRLRSTLTTDERVVDIHARALESGLVTFRDTRPFKRGRTHTIPMTNDERAVLENYRLTIYLREGTGPRIDNSMFTPARPEHSKCTLGFYKMHMYCIGEPR